MEPILRWIFQNGGISCNPKHYLVLSVLMVMFPSWICYVHTPIRIEQGDTSADLLQVNPANQRMLGGGGADGGILAQKIFFSSV